MQLQNYCCYCQFYRKSIDPKFSAFSLDHLLKHSKTISHLVVVSTLVWKNTCKLGNLYIFQKTENRFSVLLFNEISISKGKPQAIKISVLAQSKSLTEVRTVVLPDLRKPKVMEQEVRHNLRSSNTKIFHVFLLPAVQQSYSKTKSTQSRVQAQKVSFPVLEERKETTRKDGGWAAPNSQ